MAIERGRARLGSGARCAPPTTAEVGRHEAAGVRLRMHLVRVRGRPRAGAARSTSSCTRPGARKIHRPASNLAAGVIYVSEL
jgi:hypothetical protein